MGLWQSTAISYRAAGTHSGEMAYNPGGIKKLPGMAPEGLVHNMKRGVLEMAGIDNAGMGRLAGGQKYGGGIFSSGGWREILHDVKPTGTGLFELGATRTMSKSLLKFGGKAIFPAMFAYQAATQGISTAVKDNVESGIIFGAARWGLTKIGMGLFNPLTLGATALVGGAIGARAALRAGRDYNFAVRQASFGNAFNDQYGTAATMRQASLQAIQGSKINGRSALSHEASLMHS
jgi:hypothetical protein